FRVWVVNILPVRITEQVEGGRELWLDLGRLLVILNGLRKILLPEVVTTQSKVGALIIRIGLDELIEILLLFRRVPVYTGLSAKDQKFLTIGSLVRKTHSFLQVIEKFLSRGTDRRPAQLGPREVRVKRNGLIKVRDGILDQQLLVEITALQKFLPRFLRRSS